jgi:hypothetical protein
MTIITDSQYELLVDRIYSCLMGITMLNDEGEEITFGMGEMGECRDEATLVVDEWLTKAGLSRDGDYGEFKIGEQVICNGVPDVVDGFVDRADTQNWDMGYRLILKESGTQSLWVVTQISEKINLVD